MYTGSGIGTKGTFTRLTDYERFVRRLKDGIDVSDKTKMSRHLRRIAEVGGGTKIELRVIVVFDL